MEFFVVSAVFQSCIQLCDLKINEQKSYIMHLIYFADCPPGFAGENCTDSCPFPRYGTLCNDRCGCSISSCHHVYGCNTIKSTTLGGYTRNFLRNEF